MKLLVNSLKKELKENISYLVLHRLSLPFQCSHWLASDCRFLLSGFYTHCKGSQYSNPIFLKPWSLIHSVQLIFYSSSNSCSEFPVHRSFIHCWIFHCVLGRTSIGCHPRKGSSLSLCPVSSLFSVCQCVTCSYLAVVGGKGYGCPQFDKNKTACKLNNIYF